MTPTATPIIAELRLLTHRPEPMIAWWSALLGATAQTLNARTTCVASATVRVMVERSETALDYHPEASGVTVIGIAPGSAAALRDTVGRLVELDCRPYRATRDGDQILLWYRDPNGADVTVQTPDRDGTRDGAGGLFPDEVDPAAVLRRLAELG